MAAMRTYHIVHHSHVSQNKASDFPELHLHKVESDQMVLGLISGSSTEAANMLNH